MTTNGLKEFEAERTALLKDAEAILSICNNHSGHLGDIISAIRTTMSSMDIKANSLSKKFKDQKQKIKRS